MEGRCTGELGGLRAIEDQQLKSKLDSVQRAALAATSDLDLNFSNR